MTTPAQGPLDFEPDSQLFLTSLVPQQTKSISEVDHEPRDTRSSRQRKIDDRKDRGLDWKWPPITAGEEWFRHSGWSMDRKRVRQALRDACQPDSRRERFDNCGCDCVIESTEDGQHWRLRANYCGDRFCVPCAKARAKRIVENLTNVIGDQRVRFLTLTLKKDDRGLKERLDDLLGSFSKLRAMKVWRDTVTAGAYFVEITRGEAGDFWHVHVHALITGQYLVQHSLSEAWKKASKGSFIADIRAVHDVPQRVGYVAKYATKGVDHDVIMDPAALAEAIRALKGRRLLGTFGLWRNLPQLDISVDYRTYKRVATMESAYEALGRGEAWAIGAFTALKKLHPGKGDSMGFESVDTDLSG